MVSSTLRIMKKINNQVSRKSTERVNLINSTPMKLQAISGLHWRAQANRLFKDLIVQLIRCKIIWIKPSVNRLNIPMDLRLVSLFRCRPLKKEQHILKICFQGKNKNYKIWIYRELRTLKKLLNKRWKLSTILRNSRFLQWITNLKKTLINTIIFSLSQTFHNKLLRLLSQNQF